MISSVAGRTVQKRKSDAAVPSTDAQVRIDGVAKTFGRKRETVAALADISIDIAEGELLVLLGPSGCGKTTLLRCLVGLERPTGGRIELAGTTVVDADGGVYVPPNKRDVGMVFQNYALWPHMTVLENVEYPLRSRGMKDLVKAGRGMDVLRVVQCDHLADRYPPELSGGQQQRVSLARALASRPTLLLLDEPLSNLDALLKIDLRAQLRLLHRQLGFTAVYVTHDQEEALALGTRVAVMKAGRCEQIGDPHEVYRRPATEYVADFLGARNRLEVKASGDGFAEFGGVVFPDVVRADLKGEYALRLRDADIDIRPAGSDWGSDSSKLWIPGAELDELLPCGDSVEHVMHLGDVRLYAKRPAAQQIAQPGERIDLGIDPTKAFCYDAAGHLVDDWAARA